MAYRTCSQHLLDPFGMLNQGFTYVDVVAKSLRSWWEVPTESVTLDTR